MKSKGKVPRAKAEACESSQERVQENRLQDGYGSVSIGVLVPSRQMKNQIEVAKVVLLFRNSARQS